MLLRRATFDLTGLPPTEEEIRRVCRDDFARCIREGGRPAVRFPRYGERWGRHWLDVARYADSTGADEDHRYPYAWRYRDYVINAFNRDMPFDQFIREQVAGDLLPPPAGQSVNTEGIVATGFLALGPKLVAEQDKVKMFYDIVDEQIEVTGKAFLGLTIACARCHDHKFDPISTKDYYSLASIFASTKQLSKIEGTVSQALLRAARAKRYCGRYEAHQKKVEDKQKEIDAVQRGGRTTLPRCACAADGRLHDRGSRGLRDGRRCDGFAKERSLDPGRAGALDQISEADQGTPRSPGALVSGEPVRSRADA